MLSSQLSSWSAPVLIIHDAIATPITLKSGPANREAMHRYFQSNGPCRWRDTPNDEKASLAFRLGMVGQDTLWQEV